MVAILLRVTCVTKRPKTQCLEDSESFFSCDNLKQEFRVRERRRGLAPYRFSGTQANCLSAISSKQPPGHSGGSHLPFSSQKERLNVKEHTWQVGEFIDQAWKPHTSLLTSCSRGRLVTRPYLIAEEPGNVATSSLWQKSRVDWVDSQQALPQTSSYSTRSYFEYGLMFYSFKQ